MENLSDSQKESLITTGREIYTLSQNIMNENRKSILNVNSILIDDYITRKGIHLPLSPFAQIQLSIHSELNPTKGTIWLDYMGGKNLNSLGCGFIPQKDAVKIVDANSSGNIRTYVLFPLEKFPKTENNLPKRDIIKKQIVKYYNSSAKKSYLIEMIDKSSVGMYLKNNGIDKKRTDYLSNALYAISNNLINKEELFRQISQVGFKNISQMEEQFLNPALILSGEYSARTCHLDISYPKSALKSFEKWTEGLSNPYFMSELCKVINTVSMHTNDICEKIMSSQKIDAALRHSYPTTKSVYHR